MVERSLGLEADIVKAGLPFKRYEAWRSPARQAALLNRSTTGAKAWESFHQYGLAEDWVGWERGRWSWSSSLPWREYHELAARHGLVPLKFEKPHVQVAGLRLADLMAGKFPPSGGLEWETNLGAAILAWGNSPRTVLGAIHPGAPPWNLPLRCDLERPPLEV